MNIFFEIHRDLPREGPGDDGSTRQAFAMLKNLAPDPRILDIGCGPGKQTLVLAGLSSAPVLAVDTHRPFLGDLARRAAHAGLGGKVLPLCMSMFDLGLASQSFDLIWSEGAIYIIGFGEGLKAFQRLLKPGGYLAATELSWLQPDPPAEIKTYWEANYPGMQSVPANIQAGLALGCELVGWFALPDSSWMAEYYLPMEERIASLRRKYAGDPQAAATLAENQLEVDLFRKYSAWYGYVFYIFRNK